MEHIEHSPATIAPDARTRGATETRRNERSQRIQIEQHGTAGLLWFIGWLFSIGFLHLSFWKGLLALLIWPYFIGTTISSLLIR
jgi:hypothetical protein